MPIHFRCPHCAKLLALGTRQGGTQIQCPLCTRLLTVPRRTEVNVPTTTVMPPDRATECAVFADCSVGCLVADGQDAAHSPRKCACPHAAARCFRGVLVPRVRLRVAE